MSGPSEIVVHCGLHKTGTTAVQLGIADHFDACLDAGIYLYNGNNGNASHHGLAARLSQNHLKSHDMLAEVVQNICLYNQPTTFISSEDFQSILTSPDAMQFLTDALRRSGADKVTYLIYLRNPISYLTSMYLTLMFFEYSVPFTEYFRTIMDEGSYRYRKWKLHFDYQEIAQSLEAQNVDFVIRDYHQLKDGNAVADVLDFLGAPQIATEPSAESRKGVTKNKRKFTRYCRHVLGADETNPAMFNVFEGHLEATKLYLPVSQKMQVLERFETALSFVDENHGTSILTATLADVENAYENSMNEGGLTYSEVFHGAIRSDLGPVLPELASGKRRALSRQLMKRWGWLR